MIILAADTSTSILSVAVCQDGRVLAETATACGRAHSERLMDTVGWVLRESGLELGQIEALAISSGPGSFTGLRVGAAAFKGLALALQAKGRGVPLVSVPTLDAMVRGGLLLNGHVCVMLDARMREVFTAAYRVQNGVRIKLTSDRVCGLAEALEPVMGECDVLFLGDGAILYEDAIRRHMPGAVFAPETFSIPRAAAVADEALARLASGDNADPRAMSPVYLRKSQAEIAREVKQAAQA